MDDGAGALEVLDYGRIVVGDGLLVDSQITQLDRIHSALP
jgi:hypothetical protein